MRHSALPRNQKREKFWVTGKNKIALLTLVVSVGIALVYVWFNQQVFEILMAVSPGHLLFLCIARACYLASNGLFLKAFMRKMNVSLPFRDWIGLPFITAMGNQIVPFSGGMVARAAYLKRAYALPYAKFAVLLAANYLVIFGTVGVLGLSTMLIYSQTAYFSWKILGFFLALLVMIAGVIAFPTFELPWQNRWCAAFNQALSGWRQIRGDARLITVLVLYTLLNLCLNAVSFWVAYRSLSLGTLWHSALLVSLFAELAIILNITPGGWGIQEAVITFTSTLVGVGTEQGFAAALLIRAASLTLAFTLGPVFSYVLTRRVVAD